MSFSVVTTQVVGQATPADLYVNPFGTAPAPTPVVDPPRVEKFTVAANQLSGALDGLGSAVAASDWQTSARAGFDQRYKGATRIVAASVSNLQKLARWGHADRDLATFEQQLRTRSNQASWIVAQLFAHDPTTWHATLHCDTASLSRALPRFSESSDTIRRAIVTLATMRALLMAISPRSYVGLIVNHRRSKLSSIVSLALACLRFV